MMIVKRTILQIGVIERRTGTNTLRGWRFEGYPTGVYHLAATERGFLGWTWDELTELAERAARELYAEAEHRILTPAEAALLR